MSLTESAPDAQYEWKERDFWLGHGAPEGMCWSVREMFSYSSSIAHFTAHLQAMADGLDQAYFETYYWNPEDDPIELYDEDDRTGMFVVGLRPLRDEDMTTAQRVAKQREHLEREQLARLKEKYEGEGEA